MNYCYKIVVLFLLLSGNLYAQMGNAPLELRSKDFEIVKEDSVIVDLYFKNISEVDTIVIKISDLESYLSIFSADGNLNASVIYGHKSMSLIGENCNASSYSVNPNYAVIPPKGIYDMTYNFGPFSILNYGNVRRRKGDKTKYLFFVHYYAPSDVGNKCDKIVTGEYTTEDFFFYTIVD